MALSLDTNMLTKLLERANNKGQDSLAARYMILMDSITRRVTMDSSAASKWTVYNDTTPMLKRDRIGSVEIVNSRDELEHIYFIVPESVIRRAQSDEFEALKERVMHDVPRDNPVQKCQSFLDMITDSLVWELTACDFMKRRKIVLLQPQLLDATFMLSIVLNALSIIVNTTDRFHAVLLSLLWLLGLMHAVLSLARFVSFAVSKLPMNLLRLDPELAYKLDEDQGQGLSLASTGMLWLLIMYSFAMIAHQHFRGDFPEGECSDVTSCIAFVMNFGLRAGGGLGDYLRGGSEGHSEGWGRMVFDTIYFILSTVVMANIVSGIIIDAFGESRDKRNEVLLDQKNYCFVCSLAAAKFDRADRQTGFSYHYKRMHNMWAYVYFVAYLKLKDPTELTGTEDYVKAAVVRHSIDWLPVLRASMGTGERKELRGDTAEGAAFESSQAHKGRMPVDFSILGVYGVDVLRGGVVGSYGNRIVKGVLKLKGADGVAKPVISKKKRKHHRHKEKEEEERILRHSDEEGSTSQREEPRSTKTPAELAFQRLQEERKAERIAKQIEKTHREKMDELHDKLDNMSEHFEVPKIAGTH
ncbi:inositol 1,4,5-trisphosphate receptor, putative [Perkinsus marinus ATCC 50983]|uniref:Inositol 1,4,5-trisphosphate receptor, putative n=1 Tax=Perkinsus marinus (strain ATCC 50983 / TXsc) TaxID=423536 RepID=C5LQI5_PERM5|nr:inositol 1,4,5-trisphosphate receptor, putative [Perkinsus marinus ATCC 50983]EER01031.1 inositol 1,4,5-trisphosphate receptor, putative [Perkinsus marinus ATCC 50983]|eukprot:XP_002768313.1 inositol 1,4,5-trisphosphate receptor, putative [Perkinsus marinus ATCC 50983]